MKKSKIATLIVLFGLIPGTLYLGTRLSGRSYYLVGTLMVIELLIPFFLAFEGRRPQARELVTIAVLCAIAVAGRAAIPIPNFKAIFAIIMISGIAFGPESGFLVGAVSALASNFFYGQGPYTPWQMLGYGVAGLLAGFVFSKNWIARKPLPMAVFGAVCVVLVVGPILDLSDIFLKLTQIDLAAVVVVFAAGLPVNVSQAVCTFLTLLLIGKPLLEKLDRLKEKYGMMEAGGDGI
ncbi:MAG: ECF transporter S component [Oscillospiraceae bacterium]|nr:ECF transporter S component [Oscillospiraceae bacterium]